jgi:hypothetical protein
MVVCGSEGDRQAALAGVWEWWCLSIVDEARLFRDVSQMFCQSWQTYVSLESFTLPRNS